MAARRAAECGGRVTLLEKNDRLGLKILISGGGKCNLTHAGSMEEIRAKFRQNEARFLKPSFYKFTNDDFLRILHGRNLATYARPDGRIFPVEPANAKDVAALLTRYVEESGAQVQYNAAVTELRIEDGHIFGVEIGGETLAADRVIVGVGGSSYPATGTTGDGWKWLAKAGHAIAPLRAALAPLYMAEAKPEWSGIALREILLKARSGPEGKEFACWSGDLLFTHKGVSGPAALGISREIAERDAQLDARPAVLEVDLLPEMPFEALQVNLRQEIQANPRKTAANLVSPHLPARFIEPLLAAVGIAETTRGAHLSSKALNKLAATLKSWQIGIVRHVPLERGEVVAGGVTLDEVDSQTMASRLVSGLFLCGEMLDIAGPVGGYNLQAAWSTGWVAGESAAKNT